MDIIKKKTSNRKTKKMFVILFLVIVIIIGILAGVYCHNCSVTQKENIGNTKEINELIQQIKEQYNETINIVIENNKTSSMDFGDETKEKFNDKYNNDDNSALICVAIDDGKISMVAGKNIEGYFTSLFCSDLIDNARYYFKDKNYNKGIEKMLKYYLDNHPTSKVIEKDKLYFPNACSNDKNSWSFQQKSTNILDLEDIPIIIFAVIICVFFGIIYGGSNSRSWNDGSDSGSSSDGGGGGGCGGCGSSGGW